MLIKKIIIDNIKTHSHFEFEPAENGLTAISGDNGAGKSTIVDSFAWSLYGTRPKGLKNEDLIRDSVDPSKQKVQVQSYFELGNREYKVIRRILSKSITECTIFSRPVNGKSWQKESGPAVTHAETYIRTLLGTDEKGFLSSVFVQQKEVDQIVRASSKERGQVIEKLIGISSITEAINLANDERKALQKAANIIQVGSLEEELKKVEDQKEYVKELNIEKNQLEEELLDKQKKFDKASIVLAEERELQLSKTELEAEKSKIESSVKIYTENLTSSLSILETHKIKRGRKISVDLVKEELDEKQELLNSKRMELSKKITVLSSLESVFKKVINEEETIKKHEKLEHELTKIERELSSIVVKIAEITASKTNQKKYLKILNSGSPECQTCGQEIHNHEEEIEKVKKELDESEILLSSLEKEKSDLLNKYEENKTSLNLVLEDLSILEKQKENKEILNDTFKEKEKLELDIVSIQAEFNIIQKKYIQARTEEQNKELISKTKGQVDKLQSDLKIANKTLTEIKTKLENHKAKSKSEFNKLEKAYSEMDKELNDLKITLQQKIGKLELEKERGRSLLTAYKSCVKANEDYGRLTHQLTVTNLSVKSLTQFKEERVKASIPALTDLATEIFNKFTEGKYTKLTLTDKFETMIETKDRVVRSVKTLSGGELSAAALALRIAIALFLGDGEQKLLILDEVLAPMSEDRSQLILETISSVTKAQIILIAHNRVINAFADKVVEV